MTTKAQSAAPLLTAIVVLAACGTSDKDSHSGDARGGSTGLPASGGAPAAGQSSSGGAASGGVLVTGAGGTVISGVGGAATGGSATLGGSSAAAGGSSATGTPCTLGAFPSADPSVAGPFATMTETNVGPLAGVGDDGTTPVQFTIFRPKDLSAGGLCHPVVTWGNGTGSSPSLYKVLLNQLASHGFVVIASDSPQVSQGDPPPMVAGVSWIVAQNDDPASEFYQRVDVSHIGATGHSQGGFATTTAGADSHITTIAGLCGASPQRNLHGPALLFCGGSDTTVPCTTIQNAFNAVNNQPIMLAEYLTADHANWVTFRGTTPSPVEAVVTAWMRVQLMGDTALRSWFYGADCKLCKDEAWQITQKMMDQ